MNRKDVATLDPVACAEQRIDACKRYGMDIDPRDEKIVADSKEEK